MGTMGKIGALPAVVAALVSGCASSDTSSALTGDTTSKLQVEACLQLLPQSVVAKGDDGNVAANTIDDSLSTRWSEDGAGSWIQYDFGAPKMLSGAAIAWYKGSSRKSKFVISVSNDGASFTQVFSGTSSGLTTNAETYSFDAVQARYMRITVNGNSSNNWASITESRGCGSSTTVADAGTTPVDASADAVVSPADSGQSVDSGAANSGGLTGVDKNGVAYIPLAGYRYVAERFDWVKNFQSGGSMRHDFEPAPDSNQCILGYFVVSGPTDEEISAKLASGPHTDSLATWADTYDLAIANFAGTRSRLRFEATHPNYASGPTATINLGDLRNKWVGAMGMKLNVDENHDGKIDHVRVLGFIDPTGLDAQGKPKNGWVKTFDVTMTFDQVKLKSPTVPYVVSIGHPEASQATMRIDQQTSSYKYNFVAYRALQLE